MDRDAIGKLPLFEWRDQKYPVMARQVSFAHEGAEHRIQYRDNDFIEQLGPHSLMFTYTIPMRQGIASGPYKDLFTVGYPLLYAAMRDREKGVLVDPVLGEFVCVPVSFSDDLDVAKRDGTDVRIEFKHAPDIDEAEDLKAITIEGLASDAGALDEELKKVNWEQLPSPEPTMDVLNSISGFGARLEQQGTRVGAALEHFAWKCEKIDMQIDALKNPNVWPLKRAVRRNRAVAVSAAKRVADPTQEIAELTTNYNRTISTLAQEVGMTVQELLEHNPSLAQNPYVPAGTPVNILVRNKRAV